MIIGEISDNLLTNDSLIGQTYDEIADQDWLKVEFRNVYGEKLVPERIKIRNDQASQIFDVSSTTSRHYFGQLDNGNFNADWLIDNGNLLAKAPTGAGTIHIVTEIYDFKLEELQVGEKIYTDFRLIQ